MAKILFKKGHKVPKKWRKSISKAQKGKKLSFIPKFSFKKGQIPWNKGKKGLHIAWNKNKKGIHLSPNTEFKKGMIPWNRGKGWKITLRDSIESSFKYRQWRLNIFNRDNFTCQECKEKNIELHPHHIKSLSEIIKEYNIKNLENALICEELWDLNNGITLCINCHKKTDNYGNNRFKK